MKIPSPYQRKRARIEIIPLIDIMFFLLATFVVVSMSMVKNQGIVVKLPSAETSAAQERSEAVTISITESGEIYLNKDMVTLPELQERLKRIQQTTADLSVLINGDEEADFGLAISVFDQVRLLGISKVSVQTKK